jgi:phosphoribosyl 1,2-cyclic phosphodiesterase
MLDFISFGSGSSGNCYLLKTDSEILMIDSGVGVRTIKKYFHDYAVDFSKIKNILVTHDHADHVKSVGVISIDYNIPVYATEEVHRGIEKNYCVRKKVPVANKIKIVKNNTYKIGEFRVTPFDIPHDSLDNVGYRIEYNGITFCLMTDVGHVTDEVCENISIADYLVIEANHDEQMLQAGPYPQYLKDRVAGPNGHLSNKQCAEAIAKHASEKLKHVWLCHLSEENNHPELLRKTMEQVLGESGYVIGKNINVDILKRKQPTGFFSLE